MDEAIRSLGPDLLNLNIQFEEIYKILMKHSNVGWSCFSELIAGFNQLWGAIAKKKFQSALSSLSLTLTWIPCLQIGVFQVVVYDKGKGNFKK